MQPYSCSCGQPDMAEEGDSRLLQTCFLVALLQCLHKVIAAAWMSCNYTPATTQSDSIVFFSLKFNPASAYQWRWAWEQRQRSSGSVSGSCRPNAQGCCGWSGIRGRGETWAGQHVGRKRHGQFEHKQWVKSQWECSQKARQERKYSHKNQHHCIIVLVWGETKMGRKHVFLCISKKVMLSSVFSLINSCRHSNIAEKGTKVKSRKI